MSWAYTFCTDSCTDNAPRYEKRDGKWHFVCCGLMTEVTNAEKVAKLEHEQTLLDEMREEFLVGLKKITEE